MNRKHTLILIVLLLFSMLLCACKKADKDNNKISIVCTIFPQYDFVRELVKGADNIEVKLLLKAGQESHSYDPSSNDILSIHNADMFIYVGGESDSWVTDVLKSVDTDSMCVITLLDAVDAVEEVIVEGMQEEEHEEEHEDADNEGVTIEYDEHVWTSIANAMKITDKISSELCKLEGVDTELIEKNTKDYLEKLSSLDTDIKSTVASAKRSTILVADRFPLRYFCDEYGLKYYAAFAGCATSLEPSSSTLIFLTDKVKELKLPYIFSIELSSRNTADYIASETGAKILTFHSCHNLSSDDLKAGKTYIELMTQNLENLKEALN